MGNEEGKIAVPKTPHPKVPPSTQIGIKRNRVPTPPTQKCQLKVGTLDPSPPQITPALIRASPLLSLISLDKRLRHKVISGPMGKKCWSIKDAPDESQLTTLREKLNTSLKDFRKPANPEDYASAKHKRWTDTVDRIVAVLTHGLTGLTAQRTQNSPNRKIHDPLPANISLTQSHTTNESPSPSESLRQKPALERHDKPAKVVQQLLFRTPPKTVKEKTPPNDEKLRQRPSDEGFSTS